MSTLRDANGTVLTKSALLAKTTSSAAVSTLTFTETIYEHYNNTGTQPYEVDRRIKYFQGQQVPSTEIDTQYANRTGQIATVTPATGGVAGGTNVTIVGSGLSGVTAVTIGNPCTNVTVVDDTTVTCRTAATTAGQKNVVLTDDSGTVTKTNGFTFA